MRRQRGGLFELLASYRVLPSLDFYPQPHRFHADGKGADFSPPEPPSDQALTFRGLGVALRLQFEDNLALDVLGGQVPVTFDPEAMIEKTFHRGSELCQSREKLQFPFGN